MTIMYRKLKQLGLSETVAKIYIALLKKRELSAMEIHELTGVPRSRIYEIAQKMMQKGMCIEKKAGRSKKYQAVLPKRVFENLIRESKAEHVRKSELAEVMISELSPLYDQGLRNTDVSEYVEIIKDVPSIHERYTDLVRNSRFEILGFVKPPYTHQRGGKKLDQQEDQEISKLSAGVTIKGLYEYEYEDIADFELPHIERCIAAGEQVRFIKKLPVKMYIFDRKFVLMAMSNGESATSPLTMLVVDHPALASASKILFDHMWENALDLDALKSMLEKIEEQSFD